MVSLPPLKGKGVVMSSFSHRLAGAPVTKLLKGTRGATRYLWHLIKPGSLWKTTVSASGGLSSSQVHFSKKALHTISNLGREMTDLPGCHISQEAKPFTCGKS